TREEAIGHSTVELGHWTSEEARREFLQRCSKEPLHEIRNRRSGQTLQIRIMTTRLELSPEPLLLVMFQDTTREYEAEKALQESHLALQQRLELFAATEKLARVGHWTNASSEEKVVWSQGLFELAGLTPSESLYRSQGRSGIHPDDEAAWLAAREAMDGRDVEYRWRRPDNGQMLWLRTRMRRTAIAGNPQTDFGVVQDITTEKEAEQARASQLEMIRNLTERVPGMVFQVRVPPEGWGAFEYASEATRDVLGVEPADLYRDSQLLFSCMHPDDRRPVGLSITDASARLEPWKHEFRVLHPEKGIRWCSAEGLPHPKHDGSVAWYGYAHDVTDVRQASLELERQHRMLDAVRLAQAAYIEAEESRESFEGLLQALLKVTQSSYGFIGEVLYDEGNRPYLRMKAITDIAWDDASRRMLEQHLSAGLEFRNPHTLFGHAMVTGESVIANDPSTDPRSGGLPEGHPPMSSFLGIPLAVGDRQVAMVGLANATDGYGQADVEFLQPLLGAVRQLVLAQRGHAERMRARQQLQATSALLEEKSSALQVTLDSISQGLIKVGSDNRVSIFNRRLLELLDLPEELLVRRPTQENLVRFQAERGDFGADFSLVEPAARQYVATLLKESPESYWRRTLDGRTLEVRTRLLPEGGMVRTFADVSSYIEVEQALRDERQRLSWVLEATGPGIWELDVATGLTMYSERWAALLGRTLDELQPATRETWRSLVHPEDLERAHVLLQAHLKGESKSYDCDLRMRHKNGEWLWFNDRGRVHRRDADGRPLYMSGTLLDIHLRVTAQEEIRALNANLERRVSERTAELERSMRDIEVISYSIAHDLRAPLRSVNGFASLIGEMDGERLSPEGRMMFERIASASRNMGQMITDMLELLRVVRVEIEPEPVNMNELAKSVVEALAPGVPHARIEVQPLPPVMGDAKLLRQLLSNLMDNALKYSRHRDDPVVELGFDAKRQAFYLRDNGMGFDMAHASKLFGLFQRLHAGATAPGGTGVGLAIVARTLERHGGKIWAEAQPGVGATFWWTMPMS
ncbi:MAG: PAS domain-containing protein, partial [Hydrogenophaga sp.]|nr:PAS domain-containing protein [Hydrogenophaga sp.]